MSLFKDVLDKSKSLFVDEHALNYEFLPGVLPHRESEQGHLATCIKPLFMDRAGRNLLIHGPPGVGKTAACRYVLRDLEENTDRIQTIFVSCWKHNTTFKVLAEVCNQIGYAFTHNKKTDELMRIITHNLNKSRTVFVFDEVDKAEDTDFLYFLLEEIDRKVVFAITNFKEWLIDLDERVKSRLTAELLEFKAYSQAEVTDILRKRLAYAFRDGVWSDEPLGLVASRTVEAGDVRVGLYLLKEAGMLAEEKFKDAVLVEHVEAAIKKLDEFTIKNTKDLDADAQLVLSLCRKHAGKKIGEIFELYESSGGKGVYKTFQRKVRYLAENKFITQERVTGGSSGSTTIIHPANKSLTEF
ncbi:MAG: Cdc6/Cdc18 family protein [Candidatus Woesearchaeota archaeon]